jgi:hypothetical protein
VNNTDTNIRLGRVFDEASAIVRDKNPRYGSSWRGQGWRGNLSRILEKSGRLRTMLWRRDPELLSASKEHPRETMLDMINTLAFAIINLDDGLEYGHEEAHSRGRDYAHPELVQPSPDRMQDDGTGFYARGAETWPGNEDTLTNLGIPGEEGQPLDPNTMDVETTPPPPSPQPRAKVTDRGSGPRKRPVKDAPQA